MNKGKLFYQLTELDATNYPELREQILKFASPVLEPRTYPGFPKWQLSPACPRFFKTMDGVLTQRRCIRTLSTHMPSRKVLSHLLQLSHGITGTENRGPVPSGGGLQALELYCVIFESSWIPSGLYHYDRRGHHLSQISLPAERKKWQELVPSLDHVAGGALLWIIAGDGQRTEQKYGERGYRFLLLEAGHLMQNLCLLSASFSLSTVPMGGYFEKKIASEFFLPLDDVVLYVGVCGKIHGTCQ